MYVRQLQLIRRIGQLETKENWCYAVRTAMTVGELTYWTFGEMAVSEHNILRNAK